jgi:hypothetical protein
MSDDYQRKLAAVERHLIEIERTDFETAMYAHYLRKRAAGQIDAEGEGDGTPEALFWKQPSGDYGVLMFNAAWYGWQAAKGLV